MIRFAANQTSWDDVTRSLIPGGMGDRMIAPILAHLDPDGYSIDRWPDPAHVNAYLTTPSVYGHRFVAGPTSVLINHGIADKNIRVGSRVNRYGHVVVPGPALTRRLQASGVRRARIVELGYPKLDPLFAMPRVPRPPAGRLRVLYAPTHGGGGEAKHMHDTEPSGSIASRSTSFWRRDEVQAALGDRFDVTLALHPRHRPDRAATFAEYLAADVVIADGGSTMWEAWALGLPVVFADWVSGDGNLARRTSLEARVYERQIGYHAATAYHLPDVIEQAVLQGMGEAETELVDTVLPPQFRGTSGQLHAEFLADLDRSTAHLSTRRRPRRRRAA